MDREKSPNAKVTQQHSYELNIEHDGTEKEEYNDNLQIGKSEHFCLYIYIYI